MCRDARMLRIAIAATRLSQHKFAIAAVVAKGARVLSIGTNKYKSHPRQINSYTHKVGSSIHAELDAIIGVPRGNLEGATIIVARTLKDRTQALAKPCHACLHLIEAAGITRVVYTLDKEGYTIERTNGSPDQTYNSHHF